MADRFVVVGLFPALDARVTATLDPADTFSNWRRRYGGFVPVTIHRLPQGESGTNRRIEDTEAFVKHILRLPTTLPIASAAEKLHRLSIDPAMRPVFRRQMQFARHQLGPQTLGLLLSEWAKASTRSSDKS